MTGWRNVRPLVMALAPVAAAVLVAGLGESEDFAGPAGDRDADPRLRPRERAVPGPLPGFTGEAGPGRTPAAQQRWR